MAFEIFDRAGDSTGGVKEEKGLWLACQSTGNSTGGRAHGLTAMLLVFFLLNILMSSLSSYRRDAEISKEHERRRPSCDRDVFAGKERRHCLGPWPL